MARILFVSNNELSTGAFREILKTYGHQVVFCENIDQAVAKVDGEVDAFDLVVIEAFLAYGTRLADKWAEWARRTEHRGPILAGLVLRDYIRRKNQEVRILILAGNATIAEKVDGREDPRQSVHIMLYSTLGKYVSDVELLLSR